MFGNTEVIVEEKAQIGKKNREKNACTYRMEL